MLISVIIPAYNEAALLENTINKIKEAFAANQLGGLSWEMIVCDNNSTDRTAVIAAEKGAAVVFEPINQISRARNAGAVKAWGEWLLFIDADSYPAAALVGDMLAVMAEGNVIGCGATVIVKDGTLFNKLRIERLNPVFRLLGWSGGAFLLVQRRAFEAVGGFSTALFALEEIDFVLRLKRYGRKRGKRFVVLHQHPVVTSGRKGEMSILSLGSIFVSNFFAVLLFVLHYILPKAMVRRLGTGLLGYWYRRR